MGTTAKGLNYRKGKGDAPPAQGRRTASPRIVLVDDCECLLEMLACGIRGFVRHPTLLSFRDGNTAMHELLRTDPDFLITDIVHGGTDGLEMLSLLAERRVKYPILVTSGHPWEKKVFRCAGPDLNVTFLQKPYSVKEIWRQLHIHLGPSDNPQRKIRSSKPKTRSGVLRRC